MSEPSIFTAVSFFSLAGLLASLVTANRAASALLPKNARAADRIAFVWLAFDALVHLIYEGSFLYYSTFGRTVNTSPGMLATMWREYAAADARWGTANEIVVSIEILTVLGVGPLCWLVLYQFVKQDPARHYWIIVLSTSELYGGFMTFCPEWLTGSPALDTSNVLYFWVYLFFMNVLWVIIPIWLMYDSYNAIVGSLRLEQSQATKQKTR
jgi:hypothetical protein